MKPPSWRFSEGRKSKGGTLAAITDESHISGPSQPEADVLQDFFDRIQRALEDRYKIESEIGRGGMGIVYLATDLKLKRQVAIKVLRPELGEAVGADRFLREVRIEAFLDHPNIIGLFDSGEIDGLPYYVMPYVKGESLRKRIEREERLSVDEVVRITNAVGEGLTHAHETGVIHRDIKPENVLLSDDRVLVADFGIAKATAEAGSDKLTTQGIVLGTPEYMSPEQAMDDKVDHRTDVYSMGCVVYEMLAGDPPFTGRSRSSIVAKHVQERVPSLEIVRADLPYGIVQAVEKALAKVPADRHDSAREFALAVERREGRKRNKWRAAVVTGLAGIAAVALWAIARPPEVMLDPNRIMGFPMEETAIAGLTAGIGEIIALGIGSALEETAPLQWVDGWKFLDEEQRADPAALGNRDRNSITKENGARYLIDGSVVATASGASVILWLYDVAADSLVDRKTVTGIASDTSVMRCGVEAVRELISTVLQPGRDIERIPLENQDFAAVVLWMQGKHEYRSSRFAAALDFYERAVERDSASAMAALNGAQAASWLGQLGKAEGLIDVALAYSSYLPAPHRLLARGLHGYLTGAADSAVIWLRRALATDEDWVEAHMALAEVFYHLLPSVDRPLDSLAEGELRAAAADRGFSPPLFHLSEIEMRRGNLEEAERLVQRYLDFTPESPYRAQLALMLECVRSGPRRMDWVTAASTTPLTVLTAARSLSVAGAHLECARGGLEAVLASAGAQDLHWGAVLGLQGVLLATGRYEDFFALVDSTIAERPPTWTVYVLAAMADSQVITKAVEAERFIKGAFGAAYENSPSARLSWVMGAWHAFRGEAPLTVSLYDDLALQSANRQARVLGKGLGAQIALLHGDTTGAISQLGALASTARRDSLSWYPAEFQPVERLLLVRLLVSTGRYAEAIRAASVFDQADPIITLQYLAPSLALRLAAARLLADRDAEAEYTNRLRALDRPDLIHGINDTQEGGFR